MSNCCKFAFSIKLLLEDMEIVGIIPTRYNSTRFPGKPLAKIGEKAMVCHVYDRASMALSDNVWVATDDERIYDTVVAHGGKAVMTSIDCANGTARCQEAIERLNLSPDVVINIQGDEPFIEPSDIIRIAGEFNDAEVEIATLARKFDPQDGFDALFSPDNVKVVMDCNHNALYFSRSIIPYVRDYKWQEWTSHCDFYTHIGLYGFRVSTLKKIATLPLDYIESAERLEQLKWLSAGYKIKIALTESRAVGVDTPSDLEQACRYYNELKAK